MLTSASTWTRPALAIVVTVLALLLGNPTASAQTTASDWTRAGSAKAAQGDYPGAIIDFTKAIEVDPAFALAYVNRGISRTAQKDYDAAIADFDRAIELNPRLAAAYDGRGVARAGKSKLVEAREDFTKAIGLDPKLDSARQHRDNLDANLRAFVRQKEEQIRKSPEDAAAYLGRGDAYLLLGRYFLAISDYQQVIRLKPDDPVAYNNLAWLLATAADPAAQDPARALALALKAGELTKWTEPGIQSTLAAAYARNGNFAKAVEWQEKAMTSPEQAKDANERERLRAYREGKTRSN